MAQTSSEPVPSPSSSAPSAATQPAPSTTQAAFTSSHNRSKSTSLLPSLTASPRLHLGTQFDATNGNNETIAAVVSAILLLATVAVAVVVGVLVAAFVCCRQRKVRGGTSCAGVFICMCILL